jgi:hypothetical protein
MPSSSFFTWEEVEEDEEIPIPCSSLFWPPSVRFGDPASAPASQSSLHYPFEAIRDAGIQS